MPVIELARAKVNLFLHVLGRHDDGYHELESLAAFAETGDRLTAEPMGPEHRAATLDVGGPEAAALAAAGGGPNLVLRAAEAFRAAFPQARPARFRLLKRLPVASGIGGGSADAAAALRALARLEGIAPDDARLHEIAAGLGADVPVCVPSRAAWMGGVGEKLDIIDLPAIPAVLVNPRVPVETRRVFAALGLARGAPGPSAPLVARLRGFPDVEALLAFLVAQRNDLQAAAEALAPEIGVARAQLEGAPGCRLARMSGSGATCFGLFVGTDEAAAAAVRLGAANPGWWVTATSLS
jgi:4-diphosphocytidyl-2-C-methyl-D-erythritol kinase